MPTFATPEPITAMLTTAGAQVRVAASERSDTVVLVEPINSANKSAVKVAENHQGRLLRQRTVDQDDQAG